MRNLFYIALTIFIVFLNSCKGKQAKDNEDSSTTEFIEENALEFISEEAEESALKVDKSQPINVEQFQENLLSECTDFSRIQLRLINDLLELDNSSIKALANSKDVLKKYFKNATAKQCDSLYIAYSTYANLLLRYAMSDEYYTQIIDKYYHAYEIPEFQPIIKDLNTYGIQLEDVGEGCVDLTFYPDYFYEIFKPYTTEATKEYLRLVAFERDNEFLFDAGICITWEQLADRIVNFEEYLNKYPQSILADDAKETHNRYIYWLLMGCDNTPTFDWSDGEDSKLNADVYQSYQKIIDTYSYRGLANILKEYCSLLNENNMLRSEEVDEFIQQFI